MINVRIYNKCFIDSLEFTPLAENLIPCLPNDCRATKRITSIWCSEMTISRLVEVHVDGGWAGKAGECVKARFSSEDEWVSISQAKCSLIQ